MDQRLQGRIRLRGGIQAVILSALVLFLLLLAGNLTVYAASDSHSHTWDGNVCTECGTLKSTDLKNATVELSKTEAVYNGAAKKPAATVTLNGTVLEKNKDYTVSYSNNIDVGTATVTITGIGDYTGETTANFTITQKTISSKSSAAVVTFDSEYYHYNGSARRPSPTVTITLNGESYTLKKGTDYTLTYKNNVTPGTATVTIKGTGNYKGTIKATFTIRAKSIKSATVTLSKTSYTYNKQARTPTATVQLQLKTSDSTYTTLTEGTDYTVTYKNNTAIGTATVKIKGTGNYTGTVTATFKIVPKQVTVSKVSSSTSGSITVSWKTVSGSPKYQIYYRLQGTDEWSSVKVSSGKTSKTISGLEAGETYEVKVRAYKVVSGKYYIGKWSDVETVKCKDPKVVYLTFDDGPSENMGKILDILAEYDVKATFFVTGNGAEWRSMITRAYNEGHAIGLHSYSHNYSKIYKSTSAFYADLEKISDLVEELTGEKTYLLRFPGGSSNTVSKKYCKGIMTKLTKSVEEKGYTYFDWNVDSTDASGNNVSVKKIIANATSSTADEVNILMHCTDSKDTTVEALPSIIEYYQSQGYVFEVLTEDSYTAHHDVNN